MFHFRKGTTASQAHVGIPPGTYEEEHGRKGFFGKSAHLYHTHPPTSWIRFEGPLRPRCFDCNAIRPADLEDPRGDPMPFLGNDDVQLLVSRRSAPMPFFFRNADADELYFVHRGSGTIETDFGPLAFSKGDYLVLPRSVTYRVVPDTTDNFFLIVQSRTEFDQPEKGLIGQHALYDPSVIITPEPFAYEDDHREWEIRIRADGQYSSVFYPHNPLDVVGWKGDLTVWKLRMQDIRPVMSHRAHLPPSAHTTFVTKGAIVCSFLPRPLEEDPEALKVPFFHRNTDYDEFIFYHDGEFFSRDNIKPGMATLHPRGLHHGPHPKALANQGARRRTEEYAVMLDGLNPIRVLPAGTGAEWTDYWKSWGGNQTMIINPDTEQPRDVYKLLVGAVVPRPIAFVSSLSIDGIRNLAPFSFFTAVCANPPVLCFCPTRRADGTAKDTLRNVRATKEFVVHIVSEELAVRMNAASGEYPPEVDEFREAGLTPVPGEVVRAPVVKECGIAMECRLRQIVDVSDDPLGGAMVLGQVVRFHIRDDWFDHFRIDPDKVQAIGRMGGPTYTRTRDRFDLERPTVK